MLVRYDPTYEEIAMQLAVAVHGESRFGPFPFSRQRTLALLAHPDIFCMLSIVDGKGTGFFLGMVQPMWFSEEKYGFDLALYILPEYRGGATAVRLVRSFEKFCKERGCIEVDLGSNAEISTDLAKRLYLRLGYRECGFISRKEI